MKQIFMATAFLMTFVLTTVKAQREPFYKSTYETYEGQLDELQFYVSEPIIIYYDSIGIDAKGRGVIKHYERRLKKGLPGMMEDGSDSSRVFIKFEIENEEYILAFKRTGNSNQNLYKLNCYLYGGETWVRMKSGRKYHPFEGKDAHLEVLRPKVEKEKKNVKGFKKQKPETEKLQPQTAIEPKKKDTVPTPSPGSTKPTSDPNVETDL
jgi:hypothetical protein